MPKQKKTHTHTRTVRHRLIFDQHGQNSLSQMSEHRRSKHAIEQTPNATSNQQATDTYARSRTLYSIGKELTCNSRALAAPFSRSETIFANSGLSSASVLRVEKCLSSSNACGRNKRGGGETHTERGRHRHAGGVERKGQTERERRTNRYKETQADTGRHVRYNTISGFAGFTKIYGLCIFTMELISTVVFRGLVC